MIAFHGVEVSRGGRPVLREFDLAVPSGLVLALVGRSGAGKSTALKLVNRLLDPDRGVVEVEGRATTEWNPYHLRRRIGYVLQEVGLFPHMTVEQNVGVVPRLEGWDSNRIRARAHELLDLVGLPARVYAGRRPRELSGGEQQRAGVARALALDPPILLMDEPFGALDPVTRVEMHREFRRIQAAVRKTVMIVTHDMGEAFDLADRVGVLDGGRMVACDTSARIAASDDSGVRLLLDAAHLGRMEFREALAPQRPAPS
jgi:osmoprotectant transport system ATP-binding protein